MLTWRGGGAGLVFQRQGETRLAHLSASWSLLPCYSVLMDLPIRTTVSWYWTICLPCPCSGKRNPFLFGQELRAHSLEGSAEEDKLPWPRRRDEMGSAPPVTSPPSPHSFQRKVRREGRKDGGTKCLQWKPGRLCRKSGRAGMNKRKVNVYMGPMETKAGWPACWLQGGGGQSPPPPRSEVLSIPCSLADLRASYYVLGFEYPLPQRKGLVYTQMDSQGFF